MLTTAQSATAANNVRQSAKASITQGHSSAWARLHEVTLRATAWWLRSHGDYFVVGPLTRYATEAGWSDAELASELDLSRLELYRLMLCLTPRSAAELERLATAMCVDFSRLARTLGH